MVVDLVLFDSQPALVRFLILTFCIMGMGSLSSMTLVETLRQTVMRLKTVLLSLLWTLGDCTWLAFTVVWALGKSSGSTLSLWSALQDRTISLDNAVVTSAKTFVVYPS